ncbi:HAD family hydrolase [Jannaschia formosa]|uniref:HAD family hydrolase n=1 Tax=Jannaschia formosa TaxID=2259592 RepID=UPI000E1BAA41|nr:HAD family phosphatase [Jannaschia formosa]TFL18405.1 HAD family phosphatase [Jannaschia formosa]
MTVGAVVLDIGNVLIEWQPERFFDREVGEARRRAMFAAVDLRGMNDRIDSGENFSAVLRATGTAHPDFAAEIAMWHDRWLELASPAIPHSVRLMRALRARGVPVFALSNFGIETFALAQTEYDFLSEFDRAFVSGHLGVIKPAPEIFAAVETATGLAPGALLFADDRADNIAAAEARGWRGHLFDGPQGWADRLVAEGLLDPAEAV